MTRDGYKLKRLSEAGSRSGADGYNSTDADGMNGAFLLFRNGRRLACICSDQEGWEHVSVTDQTHQAISRNAADVGGHVLYQSGVLGRRRNA